MMLALLTTFSAPLAPFLTINVLEFPDEYVVPVGYNLTIVCTADRARQYLGDPDTSLPYSIEFYLNGTKKNQCGGQRSDREERKVCSYVIRNASKSDSGEYICWVRNSWACTVGSIQLEFKGIYQLHFNLFVHNSENVLT